MDWSRVVVVTTSFPSSANKASGIFVKKLVDSLAELYPQRIEVIVPGPKGTGSECTPYKVSRVQYLPVKLQDQVHGRGGLPSFIAGHGAGILLFPLLLLALFYSVWKRCDRSTLLVANWTVAGVVCGAVCSLKRCQTVTILRGSDVNRSEKSALARLALYLTLRLSSKVVCVSFSLQDTLLRLFPQYRDKTTVIENGIDPVSGEPVKIDEHGVITISIVGNMTPNKNVSVVLDALAQVDKEGAVFRLNVIGEGAELSQLKAVAKQLRLSAVTFHGPLSQSRVIDFLSSSQVYINASFSEGRSNALLEAIQCGCLPVVSAIPGNLSEVVDMETGLVFEPDNPCSLARQLHWIAENRAGAQELAENSMSRFSHLASDWFTCATKYQDLFNSISRSSL